MSSSPGSLLHLQIIFRQLLVSLPPLQSTSSRKRAGVQREQEKLQSHDSHESRLPSGHRIVSLLFISASRLLLNAGSQISLQFFPPGLRSLICVTSRWFLSSLRLLNVLEVIAPFKHFNKLREFVQMKLPPGFPVKLGEQMSFKAACRLSEIDISIKFGERK